MLRVTKPDLLNRQLGYLCLLLFRINLTAMPMARVVGVAFLHSDVSKINRPESSARGVAATCSAWNRGSAGASPAALTNLNVLPWSNTSGIRLLNGTMQVEVLPAAPLPDSVKVARRFVKPHGVGASPTLAANLWKAGRR